MFLITSLIIDVVGVLTVVGGLKSNNFLGARSRSGVVELDSHG